LEADGILAHNPDNPDAEGKAMSANEAAERLRRAYAITSGEVDDLASALGCNSADATNQLQAMESQVIDEYLRLVDPTPITKEWLTDNGWHVDGGAWMYQRSSFYIGRAARGGWTVFIGTFDRVLGNVQTVGQLRMLCTALGITLAPPPAGFSA
jgi:hypothetical protein